MKIFIVLLILWSMPGIVQAQELYVSTEPASNMASRSIGLRLNTELKPLSNRTALRVNPEVMFGFSRHLMMHFTIYTSNDYQDEFRLEGISLYGKYRVLAFDQARSHFRMATYGRVSLIKNLSPYPEISLLGDNSGVMGGLVVTQLLHKLAFSSSFDLSHAYPNLGGSQNSISESNQIGYTVSGGYLFLPFRYTSYKQINVNLYVELLGKSSIKGLGNYLDIAPAVQFIFGSRTRLDFAYEHQIAGNLGRLSNETYLIRLEHTLFNAF